MAIVTRGESVNAAKAIRDETRARGNTRQRVGKMLVDLAESAAFSADSTLVVTNAASHGLSVAASAVANRAALQAAVAAVNGAGRGILYIPEGTFSVSGTVIPPTVPCIIRGAGMGRTVLDWDNAEHLFYAENGFLRHSQSYIALEDLTIDGRWDFYHSDSPGKCPILLYGVDNVEIRRVEVRNCTFTGITLRLCERVLVHECAIKEVGRDGISCATCSYVQITDNRIDHCDDDAISIHVENNDTDATRQGVVITGNRIADSQGIAALGLRRATISSNQLERCRLRGIAIGAESPDPVAVVSHAVVIADNSITDVFNRNTIDGLSDANDYIIVNSIPQAGTGVAVPGLPDGSGTFEPLDPSLDNAITTQPIAPTHWLVVSGNTLARTLVIGSAYSSYGHGNMFTRTGYVNPTVTAGMLSTTSNGLHLKGGLRDALISGNTIRGMSIGVLFDSSGKDWENIAIHDNVVTRFGNYGVAFTASDTGGKNITIADNIFDGDPYHEHSNRGANGTWAANTLPGGVLLQSASGLIARDNVFRRMALISDVIADAGSNKALWSGNVWDCDPSAVGFSTSNRGVGNIPKGSTKGVARIVDSNPSSATYGDTLNVCEIDRNAIPASGKYVEGHLVKNNVGSATGILGWRRITTGSSHTLGADWQQIDARTPQVNLYNTSSGSPFSLTIPTDRTFLRAKLRGAGGGGGAGRRGAAGSDRGGGGGGGSGTTQFVQFRVSDLLAIGATLSVAVGAGGTGAAAITADNTDGGNGNAGGASSLTIGGTLLVFANTATGGNGGTTVGGGAGVGLQTADVFGANGGGGTVGAVGSAGSGASSGGGGGGGGGLDSANTERAGGAGGTADQGGIITGAAGGTTPGGAGTVGSAAAVNGGNGGGGGGGASRASGGAAGNGGNGGWPGGGGGGGGASVNGQNSGKGGNGADGMVLLEWV